MVARTRAKSSSGIILESIKVESSETVAKVKKPTATKKKTPPSKPYIEDVLDHILVPEDYSLPETFVNYHTPEFIQGIKHIIAKDPSLYPVVVYKNFTHFENRALPQLTDEELITSYWYSLVSGVLAQQVSGASAKAVETKFKALFGDDKINPQNTLKLSEEQLRSAGFSGQKLKYTIHISEVFADPNSNLAKREFYDNPLDVIVEELVKLKGIGLWSAKIFALFTLRELDVFTYDDLGVARGVSRYLGRRPKLLKQLKDTVHSNEELKLLLKKKSKFDKKDSRRDWVPLHDEYVKSAGLYFSPYQSAWMLILWRLGSTNIEILENTSIRK